MCFVRWFQNKLRERICWHFQIFVVICMEIVCINSPGIQTLWGIILMNSGLIKSWFYYVRNQIPEPPNTMISGFLSPEEPLFMDLKIPKVLQQIREINLGIYLC